jgi:predicted RNA-binding Zn-ribbon protein involved in translation (DUF1610 family)
MIKYSYALTDQEEIIHADSITPENRKTCKFYCLGCGNELIPRLGKVRQKHFAHKVQQDLSLCSIESYLHHTAKILLYDTIKTKIADQDPLYLNYSVENHCVACHYPEEGYSDCFLATTNEKYNLLAHYNHVQLERRAATFIPDLSLIRKDGDRIFIEIAVTHTSSDKKITSGNKIIEIIIKSEEDLEYLPGNAINPSTLETRCINFNFKDRFVPIKRKECPYGNKNVFIVHTNGKAVFLNNLTNPEYYSLKRKAWFYYRELNGIYDTAEAFIACVEAAFEEGVKIKNCYLCRYHGYQKSFGIESMHVFCKFKRINVSNSNEASECEYYRADRSSFYSKTH